MLLRADAARIPLADRSVDVVVTSPPYLRQRLYGDSPLEGGRDETLAGYVTWLAGVFDELRRVLRPDGLAWLNIGDKANGSGGAGGDWTRPGNGKKNRAAGMGPGRFMDLAYAEGTYLDVPGAVVAELIRRGWRLRLPIVWAKGQEAPESMRHTKRPRWSHEMIFMLSPGERKAGSRFWPGLLEETGSVWHFKPGGSGPAHLAPFPDELARRCIRPSSLPGDLVLDPFMGSGTVARVCEEMGRRAVGLDLYAGRDASSAVEKPVLPQVPACPRCGEDLVDATGDWQCHPCQRLWPADTLAVLG